MKREIFAGGWSSGSETSSGRGQGPEWLRDTLLSNVNEAGERGVVKLQSRSLGAGRDQQSRLERALEGTGAGGTGPLVRAAERGTVTWTPRSSRRSRETTRRARCRPLNSLLGAANWAGRFGGCSGDWWSG